ncbi:DUF2398 family protein [Kitasatospora sp. NPDC058965]|uniref:DUF2398 family protein n=1 Tax=Kitasatospora sp. NPDC058965 TaxID=3346682 RepID=UPI0036A0A313
MSAVRQDVRMGAGEVCRRLLARPWLLSGRDDAAIEAVHRFEEQVRSLARALEWRLVIEPDTVRLLKSPPERLRERTWPVAEECRWMWLAAAAIDRLPPMVTTAHLVAAAREAAVEIGFTVTGSRHELQETRRGLEMLQARGVIEVREGTLEELEDRHRCALLRLHHERTLFLIANAELMGEDGAWVVDPAADPGEWIERCAPPASTGARVLRRLVDDTVVYWSDLSVSESYWLREQLDDQVAQAAELLGLGVEERAEGVALVLSSEHAGVQGHGFPLHRGTVQHAAVLVRDFALTGGRTDGAGCPGPGWLALTPQAVEEQLARCARTHLWWSGAYRSDIAQLAGEVRLLWQQLGLLRITTGYTDTWWFSPAAARWARTDSASPTS